MGNLVITRRPDESFRIGDDVTVTVISIQGRQVRLSINAPSSVRVQRDDIKQQEPKPYGGKTQKSNPP